MQWWYDGGGEAQLVPSDGSLLTTCSYLPFPVLSRSALAPFEYQLRSIQRGRVSESSGQTGNVG